MFAHNFDRQSAISVRAKAKTCHIKILNGSQDESHRDQVKHMHKETEIKQKL